MKSMTAFSRLDSAQAGCELSWELRTVNHRYLDISLHLPEVFSSYEAALKEQVQQKLGRGKFDAKLTYSIMVNDSEEEISLDEAKVNSLVNTHRKLELLTHTSMKFSVMDILKWPGVMKTVENDLSSEHITLVKNVLDETLLELIKMRELEGKRLADLIVSRCQTVKEIVKTVRGRRVEVQKSLREKVLKKISEVSSEADNNRLEQELVYQAQRLDVDEELDRLDAHIEEVQSVIERDEPIGRRLDFLMQELNREANTLASKSNDAETTKSAVELKVLIEQMREQVMNVE